MRISILLLVLMASLSSTTSAQSLRKTEKIDANQVPVAIQEAFKNNFGELPPDGYWTSSFIVEREGSRSIAKPLFYTYHKKNRNDKIEVRYTSDGKLDFVKGLEKMKDTDT